MVDPHGAAETTAGTDLLPCAWMWTRKERCAVTDGQLEDRRCIEGIKRKKFAGRTLSARFCSHSIADGRTARTAARRWGVGTMIGCRSERSVRREHRGVGTKANAYQRISPAEVQRGEGREMHLRGRPAVVL